MTNEELVAAIRGGDETAYEELLRNLTPIILHEAEIYRGKMDYYSTEDFLQEGGIVAWKIISRGNYQSGKFSTYFGAAVRYHLARVWRDYTLKNLVCIGEKEDCRGNITRLLVVSDYAREYRIKKAAQQKRWYEKKKASMPPKEKKPPMSREERSRKVMAYQKKYYAEHPDKLAERREKNRIAEKCRLPMRSVWCSPSASMWNASERNGRSWASSRIISGTTTISPRRGLLIPLIC